MGEKTDHELLQEALTDAEAIAVLYDRYHDRLASFLFRLVDSYDLAEDLTEEAFARMVTNVPRLAHSQGSLFSWLCKVGSNEAMTQFRKERAERRYALTFRTEDSAADPEYEALVAGIEAHAAELAVLIASLTSFEQACLLLRYKENMKPGEIAASLACAPKQVSNALQHACRVLRKKISANPAPSRSLDGEEVNVCKTKDLKGC